MDKGQIPKLLNELGSTPDDVAEVMRTHGIRGLPNAVRNLNPVVRYVRHKLVLDAIAIDVTPGSRLRISVGDRQKDIPLAEVVVEFLVAFNRGDYPDLLLPAADPPL